MKNLVSEYMKIQKLLSADVMFKGQAEIPRMITRVFVANLPIGLPRRVIF